MVTAEDDDPARDWNDDAPTTVDLLEEDLAEIEREETTPTVAAATLPGFELGVTAALSAIDAILSAGSRPVPRRQLDELLDLARVRVRIAATGR